MHSANSGACLHVVLCAVGMLLAVWGHVQCGVLVPVCVGARRTSFFLLRNAQIFSLFFQHESVSHWFRIVLLVLVVGY